MTLLFSIFYILTFLLSFINGIMIASDNIFNIKDEEEKHLYRLFFNMLGIVFCLVYTLFLSKIFLSVTALYLLLLLTSVIRYVAYKSNKEKKLFDYHVIEEKLQAQDDHYHSFVYVENEEDLKKLLSLAYAKVTPLEEKRLPKEVLESMLAVCLDNDADNMRVLTNSKSNDIFFEISGDRTISKLCFVGNSYPRACHFGIKFVEKDINGNYMLSNWIDVTTFLEEYH